MGERNWTLTELTEQICAFRDARKWKKFHNPKDCAISLALEAHELLEHTQWKNGAELSRHLHHAREAFGEELCDVLYWVLLLAHDLKIDLGTAFTRKMRKNELKYPVQFARGRSAKYTELKRRVGAKGENSPSRKKGAARQGQARALSGRSS